MGGASREARSPAARTPPGQPPRRRRSKKRDASTSSPTKAGLEAHLLERLGNRVANWSHHIPPPEFMERILHRFYETYERYFVTVDPLLTNLAVMALSTEARQLLTEIQAQISHLAARLSPPPVRDTRTNNDD